MTLRYVLDTNVLVYLHDAGDPVRQQRAANVVARVGRSASAALPAQVLSELSSVALRKLRPPLDPGELYDLVDALMRAFPVLPLTCTVVLEALRGVRDHQLSYYDAQIWAAARLAQIPVLLSEDFSSGTRLEGVSFVNPFASGFDASDL
jgi:predicted nucleic acid-binding protein